MIKPINVKLSLAVQYEVAVSALPRWRLRRWIQRALNLAYTEKKIFIDQAEIGLRLTDEAETRYLNHTYRQRDYATNVLTFEYGLENENIIRSDIVLCIPVLIREAREQNKPFLAHAAHLTVHGTLHALGYDHILPAQAQRMETLEAHILTSMGIANPY